MTIQLITYDNNKNPFGEMITEINSFDSARVFDDFDINIINLADKSIWQNRGSNCQSVNCINDFKSLGTLLNNRHTDCHIIVLLPGNMTFHYSYNGREYRHEMPIKDMLSELKNHILSPICNIPGRFISGATTSLIGTNAIESDFHFVNISDQHIVTKTENDVVTTVCSDNGTIISTFLAINNADRLQAFISEIGLSLKEKAEQPEWFQSIIMFDDEEQAKRIEVSKQIIA